MSTSKASSSYGHRITSRRVLPDNHWAAETMDGKHRNPVEPMTCSNGLRCPGVHEEPYTMKGFAGEPIYGVIRVGSPATFWARYLYVTGRAGRVTPRDLYFCDSCAEKFIKRHNIEAAVVPFDVLHNPKYSPKVFGAACA